MADNSTAWALDSAGDDEEKTESLVGARFQGKKGSQGWGKHFNFSPCCPTSETCGGRGCSVKVTVVEAAAETLHSIVTGVAVMTIHLLLAPDIETRATPTLYRTDAICAKQADFSR